MITPIYAATNSGLEVYNGTGWTNYTTSNGFASDTVTSVVVQGSGSGATVFAGTAGGVSFSTGSIYSTWTTANGLGSNIINNLFLGSTGLYAATTGGLSVYNFDGTTPPWTNNGSITTAPINGVYAFGSYTYIAADQLYVYNGTAQEASFAAAAIVSGSTKVNAVFVDAYQDVYAATDNGLNVMNSSNPFVPTAPIVLGAAVYSLCLDASGNMYIATADGLYKLTSSTGTLILNVPVYCVSVDGAGTIYAGTDTGLETSKDGGSTWSTILTTTAKVNAVVTTAPLYSF
jgi:ligand-binding sensor domain-containing protein